MRSFEKICQEKGLAKSDNIKNIRSFYKTANLNASDLLIFFLANFFQMSALSLNL